MKEYHKGTYVTICLLLLLISAIPPLGASENIKDGQNLPDLEACINLALSNNPALAAGADEVTVAAEGVKEKKGELLPTIWGSADYLRFSREMAPAGGNRDYNLALRLRQPLFRGDLRPAVKMAKFNKQAANYGFQVKRQDLVMEVKIAYFNLLESNRLLKAEQNALEQAETYLEAAAERFRLGVARRADKTRAEVEVSDAGLKVIAAKNNSLAAQARLNNVLGIRVYDNTVIEDILEKYFESNCKDNINKKNDTASLPEIKEMEMNIRVEGATLKMARSEYLPSLSAGASYYWNGASLSNLKNNWDLGLSLEVSIFKGFTRKARVSAGKARLQAIRNAKEALEQRVALEIREARLKVNERVEAIENSREHLKNAAENLRIAEGEYKEGIASMLELIEARTRYVDAERKNITALAGYGKAHARLERMALPPAAPPRGVGLPPGGPKGGAPWNPNAVN
ncbi:MAG: TolC family protein [bacterium]|nr:TolC family protein [bacterium]